MSSLAPRVTRKTTAPPTDQVGQCFVQGMKSFPKGPLSNILLGKFQLPFKQSRAIWTRLSYSFQTCRPGPTCPHGRRRPRPLSRWRGGEISTEILVGTSLRKDLQLELDSVGATPGKDWTFSVTWISTMLASMTAKSLARSLVMNSVPKV